MPRCQIVMVLLVLICFGIAPLAGGKGTRKIATLDSILQPKSLDVSGARAYIVENYSIHIISLETGKRISCFGKRGEGPGEFKRRPVLRIFPDFLAVNSWGKIIFYDLDGRYMKEMKHQFGRDVGAIPLGNGYVAQKSDFSEEDQQAIQSFGIYDGSFTFLKTIFQSPNPYELDILPGNKKQPYPVIHDNISLEVYDGRIYVADSRKGFYFKVFDDHGNWIHDIKVELPPRKVTESYRNEMSKKLKSRHWWKQFENKLDPVFPEYFPEIRFFDIRDGRIYVQTFNEEGEQALFRVYDLSSKKMSMVYLPRACDGSTKLFDIYQGRYYFLREDSESDMWELFVSQITGIQ